MKQIVIHNWLVVRNHDLGNLQSFVKSELSFKVELIIEIYFHYNPYNLLRMKMLFSERHIKYICLILFKQFYEIVISPYFSRCEMYLWGCIYEEGGGEVYLTMPLSDLVF